MTELVTIKNVRAYVDEKGIAFLNIEDVARGLGFTRIANSGNEVVMWSRVKSYLNDLSYTLVCTNDFIPENIFYKLCMKANNETARAFQDLVCDDILPTIRKTGGYIVTKENDTDEDIMAKALLIAQKTIENKNNKIEQLKTKIEEDKPKVLFAKAVEASKTSILIGELAKLIKQNGYDIGQKRLFEWLRENGYLIKRLGTDHNMPTQKSMDLGLFEIKVRTINNPDGSIKTTKAPKVTGKGQQYFINKFLEVA